MNPKLDHETFREIYRAFEMPLAEIDCGLKCSPHHDRGVPVCCDIQRVIPAAFELEWDYLQAHTDLWQPWSPSGLIDRELQDDLMEGQVLVKCKGFQECQRAYRTLTCRAFPFYPYLDSRGDFLGLAYYRDFREQCWIISNLSVVVLEYKTSFRDAFEMIFAVFPPYRQNTQDYCLYVREEADSRGELLAVLDFQGGVGLIDPVTERKSPVSYRDLEAFGPFAVARELPFPDEKAAGQGNA